MHHLIKCSKVKSSCLQSSAALTHVSVSAEDVVPSLSCVSAQLGPPPRSLQSVPHPASKSSVSLTLLKLPLGNLTPYAKPETKEVHTRTGRRTRARTRKKNKTKNTRRNTNTRKATGCILNVGGHLAFILPAPSSVSRISSSSLIGLLCRSQSPSDVAKGEWDPLFPPLSFLQSKHPHAGSSNPPSPWGLYYILPLSQPSIPAAAHICPGA